MQLISFVFESVDSFWQNNMVMQGIPHISNTFGKAMTVASRWDNDLSSLLQSRLVWLVEKKSKKGVNLSAHIITSNFVTRKSALVRRQRILLRHKWVNEMMQIKPVSVKFLCRLRTQLRHSIVLHAALKLFGPQLRRSSLVGLYS